MTKFMLSSDLSIIKRGMIGLEELCVSATLGDQFRMATMFNDPPRAEDQDPVRVAHRGC